MWLGFRNARARTPTPTEDEVTNGIVVKMVGSKLVVEIDVLKAIVEGVSGATPPAAPARAQAAVPNPPVPAEA
jgi:molybdopterin-biosynthesis enzyme MoeA-like protein